MNRTKQSTHSCLISGDIMITKKDTGTMVVPNKNFVKNYPGLFQRFGMKPLQVLEYHKHCRRFHLKSIVWYTVRCEMPDGSHREIYAKSLDPISSVQTDVDSKLNEVLNSFLSEF